MQDRKIIEDEKSQKNYLKKSINSHFSTSLCSTLENASDVTKIKAYFNKLSVSKKSESLKKMFNEMDPLKHAFSNKNKLPGLLTFLENYLDSLYKNDPGFALRKSLRVNGVDLLENITERLTIDETNDFVKKNLDLIELIVHQEYAVILENKTEVFNTKIINITHQLAIKLDDTIFEKFINVLPSHKTLSLSQLAVQMLKNTTLIQLIITYQTRSGFLFFMRRVEGEIFSSPSIDKYNPFSVTIDILSKAMVYQHPSTINSILRMLQEKDKKPVQQYFDTSRLKLKGFFTKLISCQPLENITLFCRLLDTFQIEWIERKVLKDNEHFLYDKILKETNSNLNSIEFSFLTKEATWFKAYEKTIHKSPVTACLGPEEKKLKELFRTGHAAIVPKAPTMNIKNLCKNSENSLTRVSPPYYKLNLTPKDNNHMFDSLETECVEHVLHENESKSSFPALYVRGILISAEINTPIYDPDWYHCSEDFAYVLDVRLCNINALFFQPNSFYGLEQEKLISGDKDTLIEYVKMNRHHISTNLEEFKQAILTPSYNRIYLKTYPQAMVGMVLLKKDAFLRVLTYQAEVVAELKRTIPLLVYDFKSRDVFPYSKAEHALEVFMSKHQYLSSLTFLYKSDEICDVNRLWVEDFIKDLKGSPVEKLVQIELLIKTLLNQNSGCILSENTASFLKDCRHYLTHIKLQEMIPSEEWNLTFEHKSRVYLYIIKSIANKFLSLDSSPEEEQIVQKLLEHIDDPIKTAEFLEKSIENTFPLVFDFFADCHKQLGKEFIVKAPIIKPLPDLSLLCAGYAARTLTIPARPLASVSTFSVSTQPSPHVLTARTASLATPFSFFPNQKGRAVVQNKHAGGKRKKMGK